MQQIMFNTVFDSIHAAIIGAIFFYLIIQGRKYYLYQKDGWQYVVAGFGLLFFGTLLDITGNFPALSRFLIIGNTRLEAYLEKVFGYTLGSVLVAVGFWKFLSALFSLRDSEHRLKANEDQLRKIIDLGPISMAIVNMNGTIEYINRRAIETFGYLPEEIPDMERWFALAYPDETYRNQVIAQWMSLLEKALTENREIERREYKVTCKDETIKTMMIFGIPVVDKVFVMFEDLSERTRAEEEIRRLNCNLEKLVTERTVELLRSNRDLASFCYAISHELRAPVARLIGLTQALQEELADDPATAEHCANRIAVASGQLQRVIDSVLQLSRLSQSAFVPQLIDLSAMIREIAATLVSDNKCRQIEVIVADGISASGDPSLVRLCLENLLNNAIKYTVHQTNARIEFGKDSARNAFFIRDNGIGFDMAHAEKLFEPFIRLHRDEEFDGNGIGLATVQRIIERHGGKIRVESVPEQGTTFYFTLAHSQELLP